MNPKSTLFIRVFGIVGILLLAAALRAQHVIAFVEWPDEVWSLWHVRGTLDQALTRVPFDWPPLFSLFTWAWMQPLGLTLEAHRFIMVLVGVLAVALTYRAVLATLRFIAPERSRQTHYLGALVGALVYAMMSYLVFSGVEVRAYGVLLALGPLALWGTIFWLRAPHKWARTVLLAILFALLSYGSFTSLPYIAFLSLFAVVLRPRAALRWLGVGVLTGVLVLPLVAQFLSVGSGRIDRSFMALLPFTEQIPRLYTQFVGSPFFVAILIVAGVIVAASMFTRRRWRAPLLILAWAFMPIFAYFAVNSREFMLPRYLWWVAPGLALLVAYAVFALPRIAQRLAVVGLLLLAFVPPDFSGLRLDQLSAVPLRTMLGWLNERIRPNDVIVIDPFCMCGEPMVWDYMVSQYFPAGYLPIAETPGDASRVWYLVTEGWERDEALFEQVQTGRRAAEYVGPWNFLLRLYEGAPLQDGIPFGDQVVFHGAEFDQDRQTYGETDTIQVRLWWSAQQPLARDYSIGLQLLSRTGQLVAQMDGAPQFAETPSQTSLWQPGTLYLDERELHIPNQTEFEPYEVVLTVYDWQTGDRLLPAANPLYPVDEARLLHLRTIIVNAY